MLVRAIGVFLLFKENGADDWETALRISPKHANSADKIEFHHIFPRAFLKRERKNLQDGDINDIANFAFIGSTTNKQISDKTPASYPRPFMGEWVTRPLDVPKCLSCNGILVIATSQRPCTGRHLVREEYNVGHGPVRLR